jgi:outer membrane protein assembly factor BamB
MCFHRADGQLAWQQHVDVVEEEPTHETNPYCSASPVTDGQVVIAWHDGAGVYAYDLDGEPLWHFNPNVPQHVWGGGSSPLLVEDLVVLNCGATTRPFVVAVNKTTGEQVWRYDAVASYSHNPTDFWGSWSSPVVLGGSGSQRIAVHLPQRLETLDLRSGQRLWTVSGPGPLAYATPLFNDDLIVAMSGYHGPALAVRLGGQGDVTATHRLWVDTAKNPQRVGTGVLVNQHIYILNEPGIAWCLEADTGEILWKQRLGSGQSWSSAVHAEGRLYLGNTGGSTFVLEPNPDKCQVLAENHLNEPTRASPALSNGQIFLRTYQHLYCLDTP